MSRAVCSLDFLNAVWSSEVCLGPDCASILRIMSSVEVRLMRAVGVTALASVSGSMPL